MTEIDMKKELVSEIVGLLPSYVKRDIEKMVRCDDEIDQGSYTVVAVLFRDGLYGVSLHHNGDDDTRVELAKYSDLICRMYFDRSMEDFNIDEILREFLDGYSLEDLTDIFWGLVDFIASTPIV